MHTLVLSFYCVGPKNRTQDVSLDSKHFSHLAILLAPKAFFFLATLKLHCPQHELFHFAVLSAHTNPDAPPSQDNHPHSFSVYSTFLSWYSYIVRCFLACLLEMIFCAKQLRHSGVQLCPLANDHRSSQLGSLTVYISSQSGGEVAGPSPEDPASPFLLWYTMLP